MPPSEVLPMLCRILFFRYLECTLLCMLHPVLNVDHDYTVASDYLQQTTLPQFTFSAIKNDLKIRRWPTYHHADVGLHFVVNSVVQHQIHELIKTAQYAADLPICIERNCRVITTNLDSDKQYKSCQQSQRSLGCHKRGALHTKGHYFAAFCP
jgi:hypothetical protein